MKPFFFICSLMFSLIMQGQSACEYKFISDSCSLQNVADKLPVEMMQVTIKKNYLIQFIKHSKKNYLKIIVRDDLGFGKKGSLLLLSNKKQIYIKTIELKKIDKSSAYFLLSLDDTNYLENIKDLGLSNLIFCENAEFGIPKTDSDQIKKAANCFYTIVKHNIKPPIYKP
jgi:hypothetical protein